MDLVVLAAGMASRYGGLKQMESVGPNGETLLDYAVYDALSAGCDRVIFVIRSDMESDFRSKVFDRVSRSADCAITFQEPVTRIPKPLAPIARTRTKPYGTVQAVLAAAERIRSDFLVVNADDYYGRNAFTRLCAHFKGGSKECALVGYVLSGTLSHKGRVNRGICRFDFSGRLVGIEETYAIGFGPDGISGRDKNGNAVGLTGDEMASMNLFGFPLSIIPLMEDYWNAFVSGIGAAEPGECLLSDFCNGKLADGSMGMKCLAGSDEWFGMTYKEDAPLVRDKILKLVRAGAYPERLWGL